MGYTAQRYNALCVSRTTLQSFKRVIRNVLAGKNYYDIYIVNAHPTILAQYCEKKNIECPNLNIYVHDREHVFRRVMRTHNIDRNQAKKLMLRLCYLGNYENDEDKNDDDEYEPDEKVEFLINFKNEMKVVAKEVCKVETELFEEARNDDSKKNIRATVLSRLAQTIEHECLMAMHDYFKSKNITVRVLCFDGMMIDSAFKGNLDEYLRQCEKYIAKKTGYEIILENKIYDSDVYQLKELIPPQIIINEEGEAIEKEFELPEISKYVSNDSDCARKIIEIEGNDKIVFCQGNLYVFNEKI